jgi:hypothetical protein
MALIFFIVPQLVVKVFKKEEKIDSSIIYLVFASILPLIWIFVPKEIWDMREINFLQHAIGGGVATGFVCIYLIKNLENHFPVLKKFPIQVLFVYGAVSILGVSNELLEFLLDTLKIGIFSSDRYDTWFDLLANTSGALCLFLLYKLLSKIK